MLFRQLFDRDTSTYTYLLADEDTREAVLIDPVREQIERDLALLRELDLDLKYCLETHVHADHVTGSGLIRQRTGCQTAASAKGAPCVDRPLRHGDVLRFGRYGLEARATPGHTDGCMSFVRTDRRMAFTGDALLIRGCGRTDFQQGDPHALYRSVQEQLFTLPDETLIYPGHDYKGHTVSTVGEEKRHNARLGGGRDEEGFVALMRGLHLPPPARIDEAVPANLGCGMPPGPAATEHGA